MFYPMAKIIKNSLSHCLFNKTDANLSTNIA